MEFFDDIGTPQQGCAAGEGLHQGGAGGEAPRKAPSRVSLACRRCKRRKQRCDGSHPSCRSCLKANEECIYERIVRPKYPGGKTLYITALEERIAFLEARLPEHGQDHYYDHHDSDHHESQAAETPVVATNEILSVKSQKQRAKQRRADSVTVSSITEEEDDGAADDDFSLSLVDGVAYLSLCASGTTDTAQEPFYVGNSSGATIARLIESSIFRDGASTPRASRPPPSSSSLSSASVPGTPSVVSPTSTTPTIFDGIARLPHCTLSQQLFDVFFDRLHTRWPILDRRLYVTVLERAHSQPESVPVAQMSILHLILAIAARFLQLTRQSNNINGNGSGTSCAAGGDTVDSERQLAFATENMDRVLEQHNLASVQFVTLLAVYGQRAPYGAGAWSQVRYAITLCLELGLHRKRRAHMHALSEEQRRVLELRRRIFWACYSLDRLNSMILGRSHAVADRDINELLPSDDAEFWDLTSATPRPVPATEQCWSNMQPFIHLIKLRKLQSRIHRTVYRVDKGFEDASSLQKLQPKVTAILAELDEWAASIPSTPNSSTETTTPYYHDSKDFFHLQYHKAVLSLTTAMLLLPQPHQDEQTLSPRSAMSNASGKAIPTLTHPLLLSLAARSAAAVCTSYKRLNARRILSYTTIALHSCFVAGLTLLYCLWRDPSRLFGYNALEATRACSLCLTVFGERWPGAVRYRDAFDGLCGRVLKGVVGGHGASSDVNQPGVGEASFPGVPFGATPGMVDDAIFGRDEEERDMKHDMPIQMDEDLPFNSTKDQNRVDLPSDWPGWRMVNEMVQSGVAPLPNPNQGHQGASNGEGMDASGVTSHAGLLGTGSTPFISGMSAELDTEMSSDFGWDFTGYS